MVLTKEATLYMCDDCSTVVAERVGTPGECAACGNRSFRELIVENDGA